MVRAERIPWRRPACWRCRPTRHPSPEPQQRPIDRRAYLNDIQTSDDPRRVPAPPGPRGPEGTTVLRGGLVFDGTGSEPAAGTVVMERNRIAAVLPAGVTDWPEGARVLDVSGHTVLPGLMDLHTHLTYTELDVPQALTVHPAHAALRGVERLHAFIGSGITSVRDTSSFGTVPFILKQWVRDNRLPGPRVFAAGQLITATGGHSAEGLSVHSGVYGAVVEASGADGFREAVREQFKRGADLIKVASHFSRRGDRGGGGRGAHARPPDHRGLGKPYTPNGRWRPASTRSSTRCRAPTKSSR